MVGCWAEGRVAWGGGVQASIWERFGKIGRSVVVAISGEVVLGCSGGIQVNWGCFQGWKGRGRVEEECWDSGWIWEMNWERLDGWKGAGAGEKEGEVLWNSEGEEGEVLLGNSLWISALSLGWQKALEEVEDEAFIRGRKLLGASCGIRIPPVPFTTAEGDKRPARRQAVNAGKAAERRERKSELLLDWTEREGLNLKKKRECCAARGRRRKS